MTRPVGLSFSGRRVQDHSSRIEQRYPDRLRERQCQCVVVEVQDKSQKERRGPVTRQQVKHRLLLVMTPIAGQKPAP